MICTQKFERVKLSVIQAGFKTDRQEAKLSKD